jgi:asparagine synthetase B (glutamine-hydrolysing)
MAWGLEARVPFLDKAFLEVAMNIDPKDKMFGPSIERKVDEEGRPIMEKVSFPLHFSIYTSLLQETDRILNLSTF